MKHYNSAFIFSILAMLAGYFLAGFTGVWSVFILSVLETSLSFDNAIVNASILQNWDEKWRNRFIIYGMPVAVFGMRLIFPLVVVGVALGLGPINVITLAIKHPDQYASALKSAHTNIAAFGGSFLMMLFFNFFIDEDKDEHWLSWFEHAMHKLARFDSISVILTLGSLIVISKILHINHQVGFLVAGLCGISTYTIVKSLGNIIGENESNIVQQGIAGFMYLELIDASFSFDGVIGAFAISTNIFVIALGLGVGAMFVRSMTLHLVEANTINTYKYLEHGAFWAIGALAIVMFLSTMMHVPEVVSGLIGAIFIGSSLISSMLHKKA